MKPPIPDDTPNVLKVKSDKSPDTLKRVFQLQLQGQGLMAFEDALKARNETPQQLMNDLLEQFLIREKFLPDWWLTRGKGIS